MPYFFRAQGNTEFFGGGGQVKDAKGTTSAKDAEPPPIRGLGERRPNSAFFKKAFHCTFSACRNVIFLFIQISRILV